MLSRWFERGIGQIVAPDEKVASQPKQPEASSSFWRTVAPDPRYEESLRRTDNDDGVTTPDRPVPPRAAFRSNNNGPSQVKCIHCHRMTPIEPPATPGFSTPAQATAPGSDKAVLEEKVLSTAKATASLSLDLNEELRKKYDKAFRLCNSKGKMTDKTARSLETVLQNNPGLLQNYVCDKHNPFYGSTLLMVAAKANNVQAIEVIRKIDPQNIQLVDLQGQTACHIAAGAGQTEAAAVLNEWFISENPDQPPPEDLTGHTPLGRNLKSPYRKPTDMKRVLFSPNHKDAAIYGNQAPCQERVRIEAQLQVAYGYSEVPGDRGIMEDATCLSRWTTSDQSYLLFGVCDGHDDQGKVSRYIADMAPSVLQGHMENNDDWVANWTSTCENLEASLRETLMKGGTTGVFALVTLDKIVVANVGDSRCILVQTPTKHPDEAPALVEESKQAACEEQEQAQPTPTQTAETVIPLSEDHKPSLEHEKARIEAAGLKVLDYTFEENGKQVSIAKVELTEGNQLAMSRSFGDFEYKSNNDKPAAEQAVVPTPDVRIHTRDPDRDAFLVLACDGVWDVMTNEDVAKFVSDQVERLEDLGGALLSTVADDLIEECLKRDSDDNMSVVIAALSKKVDSVSSVVVQGKTLEF